MLSFILLSGCAGLDLKTADVAFEDPSVRLRIHEVDPLPVEQQGVLLRLLPSPEGFRNYREESVLYSRIRGGRGLRLALIRSIEERYTKGIRPDSAVVRTVSRFEKPEGEIIEEVETTSRGEIVRFIQGMHHSKAGNFDILKWTRTPVYPENPVRIGDSWNYEEVMDLQIKSAFFQRKDPSPYVVRGTSRLSGFAEVLGRRCAVIETRVFQRQEEHLKFLWKKLNVEIYSDMLEKTFLDYEKGAVIASITTDESQTTSPDMPLSEQGRGQSLYFIEESA